MSGDKDTMRDEYPEELIKSGVRGKYAKSYREGTNVVLIDPDLHKLFPTSEAVNRALREYRSEEHTSELQSRLHLVCRLLLEKKKNIQHLLGYGNYLPRSRTQPQAWQALRRLLSTHKSDAASYS